MQDGQQKEDIAVLIVETITRDMVEQFDLREWWTQDKEARIAYKETLQKKVVKLLSAD